MSNSRIRPTRFFPVKLPKYEEQRLVRHILCAERNLPFGIPDSEFYKSVSPKELTTAILLVRKEYQHYVIGFINHWNNTRYASSSNPSIEEASVRVSTCIESMLMHSSAINPGRQRYAIHLNLTLCGLRAPEAAYSGAFTDSVNSMMDYHTNGVDFNTDHAAISMFGDKAPPSQATYTLVRLLQDLHDYWGSCRAYEGMRKQNKLG